MNDDLQENIPSEASQEPDMAQAAGEDTEHPEFTASPEANIHKNNDSLNQEQSPDDIGEGSDDTATDQRWTFDPKASNFSKEKRFKFFDGTNKSPFEPLTQDLREHINGVFVPPSGYPQQINYSEQRIFIILGEENVGKLSAAIHLAITLAQTTQINENSIFIYRRTSAEDIRTLNDIINNDDFSEQSIYILPEVFNLGLRVSDLDFNGKALYRDVLRDKNTYFILTSSDTAVKGISHYDPIHISLPVMHEVLEKHLNHNIGEFLAAYQLVKHQSSYILEHLIFPSQIYELFTRIHSANPTTDEALQEVVTGVAELERRNTRTWFESLSFNEKLFGMLAAMLQNRFDLTRYEMESLYTQLVNRLREDAGLNHESAFIDARRIGLEDIADRVGLRMNAAGVLEFERRAVLENFLRQTENYHRLLWITTDVFVDIITGNAAPSFSRAIYALAIVIGQIGILRPDELKPLLNALADHQNAGISALAGEILRPVARRTQHHRFLIEVLKSWVTPRDQNGKVIDDLDRYWTAANTIEAIYDDVYALTEEAEFQGTRRNPESVKVANSTLKSLHEFLTILCERVVQHETQIRQIGISLQESLPDNIKAYAIGEGLVKADEPLPRELYRKLERVGKEAIREEQAGIAIQMTEFSLNTLLQVLNNIYRKHPSHIVKLINSWLVRSISNEQQDEIEIEIEQQLEAIRAQDTSQNIPKKHEQYRREGRKIDDAVLRIGFAAASYLFWQSTRSEHSDHDEMLQNARAFITSSEPQSPPIPQSDTRDASNRTPPKDIVTKSLSRAELDSEADSKGKSELSATQPKVSRRNTTRIDLENRYYSLLELLPLLMQSANYDLDLLSFLKDIPFDTQALQKHYSGDGQKFSDEIVGMLTISPLAFALFATLSWYELVQNDAQGWVDQVYPSLLHLVNDSRKNSRAILRENLFRQGWVNSTQEDIRRIGRALIARSYVLDGIVMDLPNDTRYAAVILDATQQVRLPRINYFDLSFDLIQRLSLLTPLQVYFLGELKRTHTMGTLSFPNTLSQSRELRPFRARNRLLMPLIETHDNLNFIALTPGRLHYALLFVPITLLKPKFDINQQEDVIDLADLVEQAVNDISQETPSETFDPFASKTEREQRQKLAKDDDWDLQNKFILLTTKRDQLLEEMRHVIAEVHTKGKPLNARTHPEHLFNIISLESTKLSDEDVQRIEQNVHKQITLTLHKLTYDEWANELSRYLPQLNNNDPLDVQPQIEQWVMQLNDIEKARHPGDVTLTIAWWVLMIAQYVDTSKAVDIVEKWMSTGEPLQQNMGAAITHLLFNFYEILSPKDNIERFRALLSLIEPFIAMERGYSDFSPLLHILLNWGFDPQWAQVLMEEESPFMAALRSIQDRIFMRRIVDDVGYYEVIYGLVLLQYQIKLNLEEFRMLILEVLTWAIIMPARVQSEEDELKFAQEKNLTIVQLRDLKALLMSNAFLPHYNNVMHNLRDLSQTISDETLEDYQQVFTNMQHLGDRVRLQFHNRLGDKIKPPTEGTQYGVIIVDVVNADVMVKTARLFIEQFQKKSASYILTVHRMGRRELVYHGTNGKPIMKNLKPEGGTQYTALVGPILDQYTPESVGFVLTLSSRTILDLDDWIENPQWQKRLWVHGGYGTRVFGITSSQMSSKNKVTKLDVDELVEALLTKTD